MAPFRFLFLGCLNFLAVLSEPFLELDTDLDDSGCNLVQSAALRQRKQPEHFWSQKNGDPLSTGQSPYTVSSLLNSGPTWSFTEVDDGIVRAAPLIDSSRNIYLATIPGRVYKFNASGSILWKYTSNAQIPEVPVLAGDAIVVTNQDGYVISLDIKTGQELWKVKVFNHTSQDTWSMAANRDLVFAAGNDSPFHLTQSGGGNTLAALDLKTGAVKWKFRVEFPFYNVLMSITEDSLLFSDSMGTPRRLDIETGKIIWSGKNTAAQLWDWPDFVDLPSFSTGGAIMSPASQMMYVTSNTAGSGWICAYRYSTGELVWNKSTELPANNAPAVGQLADGRLALVIGVGSNPDMPTLYAGVNVTDGDNSLPEHPARLLALDAASGETLWRHDLPSWHGWAAGDRLFNAHICLPDLFGNPAIGGDGTAYIGMASGAFYAVNDRNHDGRIEGEDEFSEYNFHHAFQGSPGLAPGMLVATPCNGMHVFLSDP